MALPTEGTTAALTELTDRERVIADLVARGLTNKEIARKAFIGVGTVEYHSGHVYSIARHSQSPTAP